MSNPAHSLTPTGSPVPDQAAAGNLTETATIALPWDRLDDAGFERLLYDLLRSFPNTRMCGGSCTAEPPTEFEIFP